MLFIFPVPGISYEIYYEKTRHTWYEHHNPAWFSWEEIQLPAFHHPMIF
jgi:hypothetical protein